MSEHSAGKLFIEPQSLEQTATFTLTARDPWQCPGCREYKAPHVDSCGCAARAESFVDPDGFEREAPGTSGYIATTGTVSTEYRYVPIDQRCVPDPA